MLVFLNPPTAPDFRSGQVFLARHLGRHVTTLRGSYEELAAEFQRLVDEYVSTKYAVKRS